MSDDNRLDEKIAGLVRSIEKDIPPRLEARARAAAESARPDEGLFDKSSALLAGLLRRHPGRAGSRRRIGILALVPAAAAVLAAFLVFPLLKKPPAPRISEIRTEFEIADKNIKIIFFQRPDFNLSKEE